MTLKEWFATYWTALLGSGGIVGLISLILAVISAVKKKDGLALSTKGSLFSLDELNVEYGQGEKDYLRTHIQRIDKVFMVW